MTQKQIEQAAKEYAFIAGAESRQAEIDELYDAFNAMYDMVADGDNCERAIHNAQHILKKHSK